MMRRIEDIVKDNRKAFDDMEPEPGHFDKFQKRLDDLQVEQKESFYERYNIVLKIAAAIVVFITISTVYITDSFTFLKLNFTEQIIVAELPEEIVEVMTYYNIITDKKVSQIDQLAVSEDEAKRIKDMAFLELEDLETDRLELEQEYSKNPKNERILNALVVNQKKKSEILDKILNTLNQIN